ncbi:MAG: hypothetical protein ACYSSI_08800, partial [Planctomycetota bacterium]
MNIKNSFIKSLISRIGNVEDTPAQNTILRIIKDLLTTSEDNLEPIKTAVELVKQVDPLNSTTDNLGNGGIFEGDWVDVLGFSSVTIEVESDQDSAIDGFEFQTSDDGSTVRHIHDETLTAGVNH